MAVKYFELKTELENSPLTQKELLIISKVENYIDTAIRGKFDCGVVRFETSVFEFNFNPDNPQQYQCDVFKDIKSTRKKLMTEELKRRYEDAGWKVKYDGGEDDGPNRPAIAYYTLSGK